MSCYLIFGALLQNKGSIIENNINSLKELDMAKECSNILREDELHPKKNSKAKRSGLAEDLELSVEKVGNLYPVLEDYYGNLVDGQHRLEADAKWPRIRLKHIKTEKQRIIARLISNACRRIVSAEEKVNMLDKLGQILLKEDLGLGELSKKIAEETGMSYTWVMKYLPAKYKEQSQSQRASSATRHVARADGFPWQLKPTEEKLIAIEKYRNSNFVFFAMKKSLYERIERVSDILRTTPEILIQSAIEENIRQANFLNSRLKVAEEKSSTEEIVATSTL